MNKRLLNLTAGALSFTFFGGFFDHDALIHDDKHYHPEPYYFQQVYRSNLIYSTTSSESDTTFIKAL